MSFTFSCSVHFQSFPSSLIFIPSILSACPNPSPCPQPPLATSPLPLVPFSLTLPFFSPSLHFSILPFLSLMRSPGNTSSCRASLSSTSSLIAVKLMKRSTRMTPFFHRYLLTHSSLHLPLSSPSKYFYSCVLVAASGRL